MRLQNLLLFRNLFRGTCLQKLIETTRSMRLRNLLLFIKTERIYKLNSTQWTIPGQSPINQGNPSQRMMLLNLFRDLSLQIAPKPEESTSKTRNPLLPVMQAPGDSHVPHPPNISCQPARTQTSQFDRWSQQQLILLLL